MVGTLHILTNTYNFEDFCSVLFQGCTHSTGMKRYVTMVLLCISLMTNGDDYLSKSIDIHASSLEKCNQVLYPYFDWVLFFRVFFGGGR